MVDGGGMHSTRHPCHSYGDAHIGQTYRLAYNIVGSRGRDLIPFDE